MNRCLLSACLLLSIAACGGGGGGGGSSGGSSLTDGSARSQLCENVRGATAVYWDLENGILRGDVPGGLPTVDTIGGQFFSSINPLLSFIYPAGYTASEVLTAPNPLGGVVVIRNDNRAIWKEDNFSIFGGADVRAIRDQQINELIGFFALQGQAAETVCVREAAVEASPGTGIFSTSSAVLLQVGNQTMYVGAGSLSTAGLTNVRVRVAAGPTVEYARLIQDLFLAIEWQFLFTDTGQPSDRDGDGVPDIEDPAPDDPTIP